MGWVFSLAAFVIYAVSLDVNILIAAAIYAVAGSISGAAVHLKK